MFSEYYGEYSDYTRKRGVIFTEIVLPENAPAEYQDRATLWNAVEKAERGKTAQLAYSFDIALQNELTMEENIALARQFVREQFVAKGTRRTKTAASKIRTSMYYVPSDR